MYAGGTLVYSVRRSKLQRCTLIYYLIAQLWIYTLLNYYSSIIKQIYTWYVSFLCFTHMNNFLHWLYQITNAL